MDTWTNVENLNFRYEPQNAVTPIVYIQDQTTGATMPIPIPGVNPLDPPLGSVVPDAPEDRGDEGHGQTSDRAGVDAGLGQGRRKPRTW